jgi:hypothetical protein
MERKILDGLNAVQIASKLTAHFAGDLPTALAFSRTMSRGVIEALIGPGTAHEGSAPFSILTTIFAAAIAEPVAAGVLAPLCNPHSTRVVYPSSKTLAGYRGTHAYLKRII